MSCDEKDKDKKDDFNPFKQAEEYLAKKRKLFLWGGVEDEIAEKLVKRLLWLDSENHEDITLFINSPGGVITSGLAIYDAMQYIKSDVSTVVCGQAASMGAVLLTAGAKGKRYAWPHARILIHQPLIHGEIVAPATDIQIQAEEMLRTRKTLNSILAHHSGKPVEQIEKDTDRDNFMSADEAVAYGLIDANQFVN
ncbi:MAG TPA: ATP-dependent Clp protease proteolytic subunit [Fibrobacteraceae bacterium]|nr:ATP-dependent Clp protease proteolytic subunit [Fibrobacteraceae bacterium]